MPDCPICGKPAEPAHRPFCSARCKQVDLSRWLNEVYRLPAENPPDEPSERPDEPTSD
jgi:endogenous inhibitor of DNA gyrase (YacG/DUF329 family)